MNPARIPDLPPLGQEGSLWQTVLWTVLYVLCIGGTVAYLVYKLPRRGDGPDRDQKP
jgi:hypothetical protein